jgi:hypothetical protein
MPKTEETKRELTEKENEQLDELAQIFIDSTVEEIGKDFILKVDTDK